MSSNYDVAGTIAYYQNLILYQYASAIRATGTIGVLADAAICDLVALQINDGFDINTAAGAQLDVLGEYIGLSRLVAIQPARNYFQMDDYQSPLTGPIGMTDYGNPNTNLGSTFYLYIFTDTSLNALTDDQYRFLLKLKIILNQLNQTMGNINSTLTDFFGNTLTCIDQADMTLTYFVAGQPTGNISLALQLGLLPKPMGVAISAVFDVADATKLFQFQSYLYDTGANIEFADYATGFNDKIILNYKDRVTV